jgi:hypothetical protein
MDMWHALVRRVVPLTKRPFSSSAYFVYLYISYTDCECRVTQGKDDLPKTSAQYSLQRPGTKTGGARTSTTPQQNGFKLLHVSTAATPHIETHPYNHSIWGLNALHLPPLYPINPALTPLSCPLSIHSIRVLPTRAPAC